MKRTILKLILSLKCSLMNKRCITCQKEGCPWWEDMKRIK